MTVQKGSWAHPQTAIIGRDVELGDITRLLHDPFCRLLTLVGPGGIGKTRLASETARRQSGHFADGIYWVELQPGQSGDFLLSAVADALSLSGRHDPHQQLLRFLHDKSILLVLDNFEHLLDAAELLAELIGPGPGVKLLVTSRIALHLQEEWLYPVAGLPYPQADQEMPAWSEIGSFAAVQLFVERVRRVRPDFSPQDEQADLLRICRLVEGMPLALELAAAWARSLDCATIAAEIERSLGFLTSTLRNAPDRHRSMQAVFTHSWSLLSPDEQEIFQRVCPGRIRRGAGLYPGRLLVVRANGRPLVYGLLPERTRTGGAGIGRLCHCPVLLLAAEPELGGAMEPQDVQRAVSKMPHCTYAVIEGAGHDIHLMQPEAFMRELKRFLTSLEGRQTQSGGGVNQESSV